MWKHPLARGAATAVELQSSAYLLSSQGWPLATAGSPVRVLLYPYLLFRLSAVMSEILVMDS
ncbi:MAG: hypothetical protein ACFBSG_01180 [Leptolyngbyaceae cyanobacterium]